MKETFRQFFKFHYNYQNKDSIILRDYLSLERTRLANERTLLSYLRTALYLLLGGFALIQIQTEVNLAWLGHLSIVLSALFTLLGVVRFFGLKKQLHVFYTAQNKPASLIEQREAGQTTESERL